MTKSNNKALDARDQRDGWWLPLLPSCYSAAGLWVGATRTLSMQAAAEGTGQGGWCGVQESNVCLFDNQFDSNDQDFI